MINYLFMARYEYPEKEIARLSWDGKIAVWSGDLDTEKFVKETRFTLLGGRLFDDTNPDDIALLPLLVSGDYLWVAEE